jgi:hypothetical protein
MPTFRLALTLAGAVALCTGLPACSTAMPVAHTGFLSSYAQLQAEPGAGFASRAAGVAIDPARLRVGEVEWQAAEGLSDEERAALILKLRTLLRQMALRLPASPGGKPAVLRASITRVETVSPPLNLASTLLLFVPLDRGGAAVEIEAVDPASGEQVAALAFGHFPPLAELRARFSRLAPAELAMEKAVSTFASLLSSDRRAWLQAPTTPSGE